MKNINPRTMPKGRTLQKITKQTDLFFAKFSPSFIAEKSGVSIRTVKSQKSRQKLSGKCANDYCKIDEVKKAGFTREILRPDIQNWYGEE